MKFKQLFCTERTSSEINVLKVICCIGVVSLHTSFTSIPVGKEDLVVNGGVFSVCQPLTARAEDLRTNFLLLKWISFLS